MSITADKHTYNAKNITSFAKSKSVTVSAIHLGAFDNNAATYVVHQYYDVTSLSQ